MANKDFHNDADLTDSVIVSYHGCTDVEITSRSEARDYMVGLTPWMTTDQLRRIIITCVRMHIDQQLTVQIVCL